MKRSYLPFIAIGMLLIAVATAAMIYLLVSGRGGGVDTVPTEIQVFAATTFKIAPTTTLRPARATEVRGGSSLARGTNGSTPLIASRRSYDWRKVDDSCRAAWTARAPGRCHDR
ncbi:unannotated protein [freshwater metagenome]|uniref:Unannotated protein n=1 Tax=freshwater metagenome TaxID=449393 RepID=A0A6J7PRM0_9ZZZZ|nr:hypothetical protein [Actinomycetota bacterium]